VADGNLHFRVQYFEERDEQSQYKRFEKQHDTLKEDVWRMKLHHSSELTSHGNQVAPVIIGLSNFEFEMKNNQKWFSAPFFTFTRGYRMLLKVSTHWQNVTLKRSIVYVNLYLTRGPFDDELEESGLWPFRGEFTIELLDQKSNLIHYSRTVLLSKDVCTECVQRVMVNDVSLHSWKIHFIPLNYILSDIDFWRHYYKNDNLYFRVSYTQLCNRQQNCWSK